MLDNSVVLLFTDFEDAGGHNHDKIPFYTFGRGGGKITPGRTLSTGDKVHNSLLRGIINVFGIYKVVGVEFGDPSAVSLS